MKVNETVGSEKAEPRAGVTVDTAPVVHKGSAVVRRRRVDSGQGSRLTCVIVMRGGMPDGPPQLPHDIMLDEHGHELADPRAVEPAVRRSHGFFYDLASNVRETKGQPFDQL